MGSGGKSKSETVSNLQVVDLMSKDRGLSTFITKTKAQIKNNEGIIRSYIQDKINLLNGKAFKKLGFEGKINLIYFSITNQGVQNYLTLKYGENETLSKYSDDYSRTRNIGRILDFLESQSYPQDDYSNANCLYSISLSLRYKNQISGGYDTPQDDDNNFELITIYNGEKYHRNRNKEPNKIGIYVPRDKIDNNYDDSGTQWVGHFYYKYELKEDTFNEIKINGFYESETIEKEVPEDADSCGNNGSSSKTKTITLTKKTYYKLKDATIYQRDDGTEYIVFQCVKVRYYDLDGNLCSEEDCSNEKQMDVPYNDKHYLVIETNNRIIVISREEITQEANEYGECLLFPVKLNGSMYRDNLKTKAMLSRLGMVNTSFDEIKNNVDLKSFVISYLAREGEKYYNLVAPYYNHYVIAQGTGITIEYNNVTTSFLSDTTITYKMRINGSSWFDIKALIIPLKVLKTRTMKEFYDNLSSTFRAFAYSEQEIHYKWYQTGFFSALMAFVAVALTAFTGAPIYVEMYIAGQIINETKFSPEIKMIIMIVLAIALSPEDAASSLEQTATNPNTFFQIAQTIFTKYYEKQIKRTQSLIGKYNKETQDILNELKEFYSLVINPFVKLDSNSEHLYHIAYEIPYECYGELIYKGYDYEFI